MKYNLSLTINTKDEMSSFAEYISKDINSNTTVLLIGDMGAGKTFFTKELISRLVNIPKDDVTSPTFSIVNEYQHGNIKVKHSDLYRVKDKSEVYEVGILDEINSCINIIEWPEIILDNLIKISNSIIVIKISFGENESRFIEYQSSYLPLFEYGS